MPRIQKLSHVVDWRLCLGCGACAYICPDDRVTLVDFLKEGIRPVVKADDCGSCRECLDVCPAVQSDFRPSEGTPSGTDDAFTKEWGPVAAIWEGYAVNPEIRYKGSSGGALTAISVYCLEKLGMHGVLHSAQDPNDPIRNLTRLSRTQTELLAATGSRYSPASVCNGLGSVESAPSPCVVIGKPSEISGVRNARKLRPELDRKIGVTLSFFCAESPATRGTEALLQKLGIEPGSVVDLRYRGHGWPGHFAPTVKGAANPAAKLTYSESWAFLQAYRPWSVLLWPDGTGEQADISCGDPWYEAPDGKNPGFSLIVARTTRGREIIEGAIAAGYLSLIAAENWKLSKSQAGLLAKKGEVWGRRAAMRLLRLPVTRLEGIDLWHCWKIQPLFGKLRSTVGTIRRIFRRKIYRRLRLDEQNAKPVKMPLAR
ncbi:MAG: hypothetical protein JWM88_1886 [Verrucomicrobia bacterium]|nr:hypothetical protein [Verrucomicrobiota bacterium]